MTYSRTYNSALALSGLAVLAFAAGWTVRFARAERAARAGSPALLARALQLAPGSAEYHLQLADLLDARGADPRSDLEAAAALNPDNASTWIELGLQAEARGDLDRAQRDLLEAARRSAQYQPRWTLANYYFRHHRPDAFWRWASQALVMSYGDRRPLFDLCWQATQEPNLVLRALPERPPGLWRDYLAYLLEEKRLDAAAPVAARILDRAQPDDLPLLLAYDNALLDARLAPPALSLWNRLCDRRLLPYAPLAAARGLSVTNGAFSSAFAGGGFDWRLPQLAGVETVRARNLFRAAFDRRQPETCEILWQYLPLVPGRTYDLTYEYQTQDISPDSGLSWKLLDAVSPQLSSPEWKTATLTFTAAADLARLVLAYQRPAGATRIEGTLWLRDVSLRFHP